MLHDFTEYSWRDTSTVSLYSDPIWREVISSMIVTTVTCDHGVRGRTAFLLGLSRRGRWGEGDPHNGGGQDLVHSFMLHSRA